MKELQSCPDHFQVYFIVSRQTDTHRRHTTSYVHMDPNVLVKIIVNRRLMISLSYHTA